MLANCKAPLPTTSALTTTGRSNYKLWLCSRCRRSSTRRRRCRRSRCRGDSRSPTRRCRGQSVSSNPFPQLLFQHTHNNKKQQPSKNTPRPLQPNLHRSKSRSKTRARAEAGATARAGARATSGASARATAGARARPLKSEIRNKNTT